MLKVMSIVGTRPELIKMSRVIAEFDRHTHHILVHTGQNSDYELNQVFFDELEIREPDYMLSTAGENAAQTIAQVIMQSDDVLEKERPDALLLYGDTNSCMAVIAAKRRKIPVFHMEAGNRCFDQRVPEELNRKVIDHLSDINLVLTEHARRYLIAEGIRPETIIKNGSHMPEVLDYYRPKFEASDVLSRLQLEAGKYFLVSAHREENVDTPANLLDLVETLNALAETYGHPVIVSTHPRSRKRLDALESGELDHRVRCVKPFSFCDYIKLQPGALCILSDSGTLTEEAALLDLPAVAIRHTHERPEGMDAGVLIMSGLKKDSVLNAVQVMTARDKRDAQVARPVLDYAAGRASEKVLRIVLSYIDYVKRTVWSNST